MKGSILAGYIMSDYRKEKIYKNKKERAKCIVDNQKQCDRCKYIDICENKEIEDEIQM